MFCFYVLNINIKVNNKINICELLVTIKQLIKIKNKINKYEISKEFLLNINKKIFKIMF